MPQAKTLTPTQLRQALKVARESAAQPHRDALMLALSFYAGLRAKEIACLEVADVTDVQGRLTRFLQVSRRGAKYGKPRRVPLASALRHVLAAYLKSTKRQRGPLFLDRCGKPLSSNAVQQQIRRIYDRAGFSGASSHSGRRSFITMASRMAGQVGCSLRDVQFLAGHSDIATTEKYIDFSDQQVALVDALWARPKQDASARRSPIGGRLGGKCLPSKKAKGYGPPRNKDYQNDNAL